MTLTLITLHPPRPIFDYPPFFINGADEVIEVGKTYPRLEMASKERGIIYRYIQSTQHAPRLINLAVSFASSEWIIISFGDESMAEGWLPEAQRLLALENKAISLFTPLSAPGGIPMVAIRRKSFVYGATDERFPSHRLSLLHWVYRIYAQASSRVLSNEGIATHGCDWLLPSPPPSIKAPIAALMELWHHLDPEARGILLDQAIAQPNSTQEDLQSLAQLAHRLSSVTLKPYREGGPYNAKHFWEDNTEGYVKWEVYQPDEPEILGLIDEIPVKNVLELGCGAGRNTRYFNAADRYVGIDLSMNLLRRAAERQEANSAGIICGDITQLGFDNGSFDLVFADSTVQHVPPDKIEQCVAEIARVSSRYVCLIEYTQETEENGNWFKQVHMFAHDYAKLFSPYCKLIHQTETRLRVHPAKKEVFLFEKVN